MPIVLIYDETFVARMNKAAVSDRHQVKMLKDTVKELSMVIQESQQSLLTSTKSYTNLTQ